MHWDPHHGRWVSSEGKDDRHTSHRDHGDPGSPTRKIRAASPARASATAASLAINATSASAAMYTGQTRKPRNSAPAPAPDELVQTPVDDPDLPGWLVLQRTTNTGRSYKVYHGPKGEYAESKRQAVLLASGLPLSAAQLAFKSKPAPYGGVMLGSLMVGLGGSGGDRTGFRPTMAIARAKARAAASGLPKGSDGIGGIGGLGGFRGLGIPGRLGQDEPLPWPEDKVATAGGAGGGASVEEDEGWVAPAASEVEWGDEMVVMIGHGDSLDYPTDIPEDTPTPKLETVDLGSAEADAVAAPPAEKAEPAPATARHTPAAVVASQMEAAAKGADGGGDDAPRAIPIGYGHSSGHSSGSSHLRTGFLPGKPKRSALGPPRADIKRSRVGEKYQAEDPDYAGPWRPPKATKGGPGDHPNHHQVASEGGAASGGADGARSGDVLIYSGGSLPAEMVREYLKQAADVWSVPVVSSPRPTKPKGKGNRPAAKLIHGGAFGMDAAAQEAALLLLHEHGYDSESALAALKERRPPSAQSTGWTPAERALFDGTLLTYGKDFAALAAAIPTRNARQVVHYFYDRKMRASLMSGKPACILHARPVVTTSLCRGRPGKEVEEPPKAATGAPGLVVDAAAAAGVVAEDGAAGSNGAADGEDGADAAAHGEEGGGEEEGEEEGEEDDDDEGEEEDDDDGNAALSAADDAGADEEAEAGEGGEDDDDVDDEEDVDDDGEEEMADDDDDDGDDDGEEDVDDEEVEDEEVVEDDDEDDEEAAAGGAEDDDEAGVGDDDDEEVDDEEEGGAHEAMDAAAEDDEEEEDEGDEVAGAEAMEED